MRRLLQIVLALVWFGGVALAQGPEVVDRIIAVVNNAPIFQTDWEMALRCEALLNDRTPESFNDLEKQQVFTRMVDQELLQQQMKSYPVVQVSDQDVQARLEEIRKQLPGAQSQEGWQRLLDRDGITESDVRDRVKLQVEILRFLDVRIRPLVRVDFRSVNQYYRDQYLPELRRRGAKDVPLSEVSDKIREILTQQRMDEQIQAWMQTLRDGSDIRVMQNTASSAAENLKK